MKWVVWPSAFTCDAAMGETCGHGGPTGEADIPALQSNEYFLYSDIRSETCGTDKKHVQLGASGSNAHKQLAQGVLPGAQVL